ncbi:MAG TPA: hypothetical protein VMW18_11445 [Candidatus Binatia bacterium]|nr:hypothetical protein [Candidatus Binatia bacterium]
MSITEPIMQPFISRRLSISNAADLRTRRQPTHPQAPAFGEVMSEMGLILLACLGVAVAAAVLVGTLGAA